MAERGPAIEWIERPIPEIPPPNVSGPESCVFHPSERQRGTPRTVEKNPTSTGHQPERNDCPRTEGVG